MLNKLQQKETKMPKYSMQQKYKAFGWLRVTDFGTDEANLNALIMAEEIMRLSITINLSEIKQTTEEEEEN